MNVKEMTFNELEIYYDDLSKEENSSELLKKGKNCIESQNFKEAAEYLTSSSLLGNSDAQRYLGLLYLKFDENNFSPTEEELPYYRPSFELGLHYLELSAQQKNKKTLYLLGILYIEGFKENKGRRKKKSGYIEEEIVPIIQKSPLPRKEIGIKYLEQAISLKYKRAMKYLFEYYYRERHVENNIEKAERLAKDALKMGYKKLIHILLYEHYKYDRPKQIELIEYLAKSGDRFFQGLYGDLLYHDSNDFDNGYGYLQKSADQGDVYSMYRFGFYNLIGYGDGHGDREEGFKYLEKSARNGCLAASYYLGLFHLHADHGLPENENLAIKYFHRAAIYQDPDAQIALGKVFLYNKKRLIFPDLAIKYFGLAAEGSILPLNTYHSAYWPEYSDDDDVNAQNNNNSEEEEEEEEENDNEFNVNTLRLFYPDIPESSTSFGDSEQKFKRIHRRKRSKSKDEIKDDGVEDFDDPLVREIYRIIDIDINKKRNIKKKKVSVFIGAYAGEFHKKTDKRAIKKNYMCQGLIGLAQAYKEKKDFTKSLENYQKAISYGYSEAMNELGNIYKDGSFGFKDPDKALELFHKAFHEYRNPDALYYMGRLYTDGCGKIQKDPKKGQDLIKQAVNYGSSVASRSLQHGGMLSLRSLYL